MAKILATGHAVPSQVVSNQQLTEFMETSDEWIQQRSGIKERRWSRRGFENSGELRNVDLAIKAANMALANSQLQPDQIGAIIYATVSADNEFPGSGCLLQEALCPGRFIPVVEVRNHCAGFIYSLLLARSYVDSGKYKNVLVVAAELQSTGLNLSNSGRNTAVLFGDGSGAVLVAASNSNSKILAIELASDGSYADKLGVELPGFNGACPIAVENFDGQQPATAPRMEGQLIFKMASIKMPEIIKIVLQKNNLNVTDLDLIVPHQANQRIIDMIGQQLGCSDKIVSNISRYGNTTAASIPLALSESVESGKLKPGNLICLVSFGAGFSWGAALLRW